MSEVAILKQTQDVSIFQDTNAFADAQRMVMPLSKSTMIPKDYQNNVPNCMVAMEMSNRLNKSILMVMQNTNIIHGKPGLGSSFVIALINSSGRFADPLDFNVEGEGESMSCYAFTKRQDGREIKGPRITWQMAKAEGWTTKSGSKWATMPELMFQYRAAAFFGRLHCPDILMGMQTVDEIQDIGYTESQETTSSVISSINDKVSPPNESGETHAFEEISEAAEIVVEQAQTPEQHEQAAEDRPEHSQANPTTEAAANIQQEDDDF